MHYSQVEGSTSAVLQYPFVEAEGWHWSPVKKSVFNDSLIVPAYVAIASALAILVHLLLASFVSRPERREEELSRLRPGGIVSEVKEHVRSHGGTKIYAFKVARMICSLGLLGLAVTTLVLQELELDELNIVKKHKYRFKKREWLEAAMCMTFLYTFLLSVASVTAKPRWSRAAIRHLNFVLFATFFVYCYRDVYPLTTNTKKPQDFFEGWSLWLKIALLGVSSVLIPLFIPRKYEPVDPLNPITPSPEQTACIFSLLVYTFLDPLVFYAYRVPHLAWDELPPLCDYDYARVLKERSFKHLDIFSGAPRQRHIALGLLRVFRVEYMIMALSIVAHVFANFLSPIAMNRLLRYLEPHGPENASVQPWVWVSWLFLGPVFSSLTVQLYIFIATRTVVRAQAIITQLVFEHSLRIRVKAEAPDSPANVPATSESPTGYSSETETEGSVEGTVVDHSRATTVQGGSEDSTSSLKDAKKNEKKAESAPTSDSSNLVGKINNLVTTDLDNIVETRDFLFVVLYVPVQIALAIVFLYVVLGWSAFVGLTMMVLMLPVPGLIARMVQKVQDQRMKRTDGRVQSVTETMNVLRMIKLFGWEKRMEARIAEKREEELVWIKRRQYLDLLSGTINHACHLLDLRALFAGAFGALCLTQILWQTVIMKRELSASTVFSSMAVLEMLRSQLNMIFYIMTATIAGKVSLDRTSDFLKKTELLDSYDKKALEQEFFIPDNRSDDIGFRNAIFTWFRNADGSLTPSKRRFVLKIDGELVFKKGRINLVLGETGSGKTSLLMALLSEMCFVPRGPDSWYNLPRDKGIAYAAQESWVQNETIRVWTFENIKTHQDSDHELQENIIFGSEFDEERYKKVIYQCGLERDLSLFEAGDGTEVGEKGLTLSGGQKARITLARAIYSKAAIILLDDVLAALDVHTSKWIIDKCLRGDLVKGRTVILVTHNVALARPIAGFVVSLKNGAIVSQGSLAEALEHSIALKEEASKDEENLDKYNEQVDANVAEPPAQESKGRLIVAEEIQEGHVSWQALKVYFAGMGTWRFFLAVIGTCFLSELCNTVQTYFLGYWASQYENRDASEVSVAKYLALYSALLLGTVIVYAIGYLIYILGSIRASRAVHKQLIESILGTTLRYVQVFNVQRSPPDTLLNDPRSAGLTQPLSLVLSHAALKTYELVSLKFTGEITVLLIVKFLAIMIVVPFFFVPGILVTTAGMICGQIYIKAQLSVKREMSNARAPLLGHVGAAISGLTSIRAYGVEERFIQESLKRIDKFTRAARTFYNLNRWICIRTDVLGGLFASGLAAYLVYGRAQSASKTGFSLNMAGYMAVEQEPKPTASGEPPAYWPASGELKVENLSAKYSPDGPRVLHDLSFEIRSGERVGVVGRTGSGKSSLTLSLLRCIFTEGRVYYDGLPTDSINLEALRSSITIIPQMPELLSGTLRQNLDPFEQYEDAVLHSALRAAGLYSLQDTDDEGRLTLDSSIASGGGNLSVGQRQILALARALVRGSKLLILDEATSAIDYHTDSIIQTSLRKELPRDVTLITVAHRLQTIMDADKILVLDAGRIVEFDTPKALLEKKDGKLKALVDESNDRAILYEMAEGKRHVA
ncbi:hypothetical protein V5O48_002547 [Marasmius crinis-equi]|uniref:P-loop containing nucleoside triphosphate hydrolase protein n=1 Tax=Marasmius crinis-equi TaxID=585013 RepID=A0ABR3FVA0_9AGAR